jgi:hypothetical protein
VCEGEVKRQPSPSRFSSDVVGKYVSKYEQIAYSHSHHQSRLFGEKHYVTLENDEEIEFSYKRTSKICLPMESTMFIA